MRKLQYFLKSQEMLLASKLFVQVWLSAVLIMSLCLFADRLFDKQLEDNPEQYQAVQHIVAGSSRPAPYLVFGPPGTGTSNCGAPQGGPVRCICWNNNHHLQQHTVLCGCTWRPSYQNTSTVVSVASFPVCCNRLSSYSQPVSILSFHCSIKTNGL